MGDSCGTGGGGSGGGGGGGGSGGCGGEALGVAVQALTGCCCTAPVDGSPGVCHDTTSPGGCDPYEVYFDGACNSPSPDKGNGGCSASGAGGVVEVFVPLLALAMFRAMRCRFA